MSLPDTEKSVLELPDFLIIPSQLLKDKEVNPLDRMVYGIIYWFTKLKLEKCIVSNKTIADMLNTTAPTVANCISRLAKRGYIRVLLDTKNNSRKEIVPLISFNPSSTDEAPLNLGINPPSSTDEHNKIDLIRKKEKILENTKEYLSNIPPAHVSHLCQKYNVGVLFVKAQSQRALRWLEATGRSYKRYDKFFENWIDNQAQWTKDKNPRLAGEGFIDYKEAKKKGMTW